MAQECTSICRPQQYQIDATYDPYNAIAERMMCRIPAALATGTSAHELIGVGDIGEIASRLAQAEERPDPMSPAPRSTAIHPGRQPACGRADPDVRPPQRNARGLRSVRAVAVAPFGRTSVSG